MFVIKLLLSKNTLDKLLLIKTKVFKILNALLTQRFSNILEQLIFVNEDVIAVDQLFILVF